MMSFRTRLYLAFSAIALLTLLMGGMHLFSSSYLSEMEEQVQLEERIVVLGHELLEANLTLNSLVQDCIRRYRLACTADYDIALLQRDRILNELVRSEHVASALQELEVLRAVIYLTANVETQVLARSARGDIRGAEKLFDRAYAAQQADIQHRIQAFQAIEVREALAARAEAKNQTQILDMFVWMATGATLLLAAWFVLYFSRSLARPVAALAASETRYASLFESSRDALMTLAPPSWKFTGVNQAAVQLFGATGVAELTALGPQDISPARQPDGRLSSEKAQAMIAKAMQNGSNFFQWEHRRLNGECFAADVLLTRMQAGKDLSLQATVRDVSARVRAEAEKEQLLKRLDVLATHDPLTGAWNRRQFDELLAREIARAHRYRQPLSLIMFDIDHFKNVNDTHGHLAGDDLLAALSVYVSANIRDSDILARWGGEEFMLIVPGVDVEAAARQAEKLRALIEHGDFGVIGRVTCSFGVTQFRNGDTPDGFTGRADAAMYRAKQTGRNRVERYEDSTKAVGVHG